jgi:hypothetical protein
MLADNIAATGRDFPYDYEDLHALWKDWISKAGMSGQMTVILTGHIFIIYRHGRIIVIWQYPFC